MRTAAKIKCKVEGCKKPRHARGYCGTHYSTHYYRPANKSKETLQEEEMIDRAAVKKQLGLNGKSNGSGRHREDEEIDEGPIDIEPEPIDQGKLDTSIPADWATLMKDKPEWIEKLDRNNAVAMEIRRAAQALNGAPPNKCFPLTVEQFLQKFGNGNSNNLDKRCLSVRMALAKLGVPKPRVIFESSAGRVLMTRGYRKGD